MDIEWSLRPKPSSDPYDEFLEQLRQRMKRLAEDGYQIGSVVIDPERDGERLVQVFCERNGSPVKVFVWLQYIDIT